ncbi:MAG: GDP-L-fucose synthase [Ignavibacteriales bacterium]|nr:GDP-L-fucose synthase [Ignavibacteriales bacterium]
MKNKKIYIAGHTGMVGSAILRKLYSDGFTNIIFKDISELDLTKQNEVEKYFKTEKPELVIIAAAKVGGILANNTYRAQFIYENLMIEANIIHASYLNNVEKVIFLGSSCIYPKLAKQPLKEEYLLTDSLEYTNEPYAIAKIAGIKLCENYYKQYGCNYLSVMPTNLFGPDDNFNLHSSHVLPALIRKFHEGKSNPKQSVEIWGTGSPMREFLYVEDLTEAIIFVLQNVNAKDLYENGISHLNIGTGEDISIKDLSFMIKKIVGFEGNIIFDRTKPDGTPKKLLDVSRINKLGWKHKTTLEEGIKLAYKWFLNNLEKIYEKK